LAGSAFAWFVVIAREAGLALSVVDRQRGMRPPSAERLDAVSEADQPRSGRRVGAPDPVVVDREPHHAVSHPEVHAHQGRARVLGGVRQRL
jgi:hypothetical protein